MNAVAFVCASMHRCKPVARCLQPRYSFYRVTSRCASQNAAASTIFKVLRYSCIDTFSLGNESSSGENSRDTLMLSRLADSRNYYALCRMCYCKLLVLSLRLLSAQSFVNRVLSIDSDCPWAMPVTCIHDVEKSNYQLLSD